MEENIGKLFRCGQQDRWTSMSLASPRSPTKSQVYFQPGSVVYHQEGHTLGTDESPLKKRLMAENKAKFAEKWSHELKTQHMPSYARFQVGRALWVIHRSKR